MQPSATRASEYSRDGQDGFKPLPLPSRGEDLYPGRQYYLSPLARLIVDDVFGIRGLPSIVECLHKKVAKTKIVVTSTNLDTGEIRTKESILDSQDATFRVQGGNALKFTIDLAKVESMKEFYAKSPKLKKYEDGDERPKAKAATRGVNGAPLAKKYDLSILDV